MKKRYFLLPLLTLAIIFPSVSHAATTDQAVGPLSLLILLIALLVICIYIMGNNLVQNYASKLGVDSSSQSGLSLFSPTRPSFIGEDDNYTSIKKGYDIKINGAAPLDFLERTTNTFAVQPSNYMGIRPIPKMLVEIGQYVEAGQPIFFDKDREGINFVSPVSGEVIEINRGQKRAITEVVILADKEQKYKSLSAPNLKDTHKDALVAFLKESGAYSLIVERPYGVLPTNESLPNRIYISTFDSAPLAPDLSFVANGQLEHLQAAIDALNIVSDGNVHLGLDATKPRSVFSQLDNCYKNWFDGPHPAGNVGIQIHKTKPMGLEEIVWTLNVQDLLTLGKLFTQGIYDASRTIAITGENLETGLVATKQGARLSDVLAAEFNEQALKGKRVISGNVLTGQRKSLNQFINTYDNMVSVLPEGDYYEMFGWLAPSKSRPSKSKAFLSSMYKDISYSVDTNTHGEKRAFVVTGQYESVLPVDTYPQHLFKAILTKNFERMQGLGIHELLEEDVALCEFVCTSKQNLQSILRDGLDFMREQM